MRGATNSVATGQLSAVRSLPHPGALGTIGIFRRALIVQSYSSGGAIVRPPQLIHGSLGPRESAPGRRLDRFSLVCMTRCCAQQRTDRRIDTQTTRRVTCAAIGRIYATRDVDFHPNHECGPDHF